MGGLSGEFHGLKVVRRKQEDGTRRAETNLWEIKSVAWEDDEGGKENGNMLAPTETLDDNGNHFLEFVFNEEGINAHEESYFLKKQDDEEGDEGLTDGERRRLGLGLERDEVKEKAKDDNAEDQKDIESTTKAGEDREVEVEKKSKAAKKSPAASTRTNAKTNAKTKTKTKANATKANANEDEKVQVGKKRKAEDEGEGSGSRFLVRIGDYYEYVSDLFRTHDT